MLAVSTSNHEDTNTRQNNTDTDIHNIDMDMHNMDMGIHDIDMNMHNTDMGRDRRKKALVAPDRQHIQKESSARAASQLFFPLAISFVFVEGFLFSLYSLILANIKAPDFTNQIIDFIPSFRKRMGRKSVDIGLNSENGPAVQQIFKVI